MSSWKVTFEDITGTTCTLWIGEKDADDAVELLGASEPMTSEEDDDTCVIGGVRKKTGYIRVVTADASLLDDIAPSDVLSVPFWAYRGNVCVEAGYLQPQGWSVDYRENGSYYEIELPWVCPLGALESLGFDDFSSSIDVESWATCRTINKTIYDIFSMLEGLTFRYVHFSDAKMIEWWGECKVNWRMFQKEGEYVAEKTPLEIIEGICDFFGWQLRIKGLDLFFMNVDMSSDYTTGAMCYSDFSELGEGLTGSPTEVEWNKVLLRDLILLDETKKGRELGWKTATVKSETDRYDTLLELSIDEITKNWEYTKADSITEKTSSNNYWRYLFSSARVSGGIIWSYNADCILWRHIAEAGQDVARGSLGISCLFDPSDTVTLNYERAVMVKATDDWDYSSDSYGYLFRMGSRFDVNICQGVGLVISGQVYQIASRNKTEDIVKYIVNGTLLVSLSIGDYYWNGSGWVKGAATFELPVGKEDSTGTQGVGEILNNRSYTDGFDGDKGYGILADIAVPMTGKFDFRILDWTPNKSEYTELYISQLKFSFIQVTSDSFGDDNIEKAESCGKFLDDESRELMLTCKIDYRGAGWNSLWSDEIADGWVKSLPFGDGTNWMSAEAMLLKRLKAWGKKSREIIDVVVDMRNDDSTLALTEDDLSPIAFWHDGGTTGDGTKYWPVAISRDYASGEVRLKLVELDA